MSLELARRGAHILQEHPGDVTLGRIERRPCRQRCHVVKTFFCPFAASFAPPAMSEHVHLTLYYFDIHGLGARIRIACRLSGLSLADVRFNSRDEFASMKAAGTLPFGQVPLLVVRLPGAAEDKPVHLAQSASILRYVCTLGGLQPTDPLQGAVVDAAVAAESDAFRCVAA